MELLNTINYKMNLPQTYRFIIVDAPIFPAELSARFTDELGKPSHRAQAALHALDLSVRERSRVTIIDPAGLTISTIGRRH